MKKIIALFLLGIIQTALHAQQISNMRTRFTGSTVEVTYTLTTRTSENIELLYSTDQGNTYQTCLAVKGNLQAQTSGNKKVIWECVEDGIIMADVILKLSFQTSMAIEMVSVEGGRFMMGCSNEQAGGKCPNDEQPVHPVTVSSFSIGKYPITQGQWKAVMGDNPSYFAKGDNYPVDNISWDDAQEFIRALNDKTGKNYRLPTEAEWEYAARGGKKSMGYRYSGSNNVNNIAWYENNSKGTTHPVGAKSPNELGIYDMSGNVWEWCNDWAGPYSEGEQTNPTGPSSGTYRTLRGGSWRTPVTDCLNSYRFDVIPSEHYFSLGLRLVHP